MDAKAALSRMVRAAWILERNVDNRSTQPKSNSSSTYAIYILPDVSSNPPAMGHNTLCLQVNPNGGIGLHQCLRTI